jgi:hypothetical protein
MVLSMLDDAINMLPFLPKEVRIGLMLWKELEKDGRIEWRRAVIQTIQTKPKLIFESEFEFPFLNKSILVHIDPRLEPFEYQLPHKNNP